MFVKILDPGQELVRCEVKDKANGEYLVSFTPATTGTYTVTVCFGDVPVIGRHSLPPSFSLFLLLTLTDADAIG